MNSLIYLSYCLAVHVSLTVLRSVVAHNDKFTTRSVSEIMVRNFSKVKEVFVHHIPKNKNLLQFMHRCYYMGDI